MIHTPSIIICIHVTASVFDVFYVYSTKNYKNLSPTLGTRALERIKHKFYTTKAKNYPSSVFVEFSVQSVRKKLQFSCALANISQKFIEKQKNT